MTEELIAGVTASAISKSIIAPIERVKILLQVQDAKKDIATGTRYKGIIDCFVRIPNEQRYRAFWRGNTANVVGCLAVHALNFAFNDKYRSKFVVGVDKDTQFMRYLVGNLASGGFAGVTSLCLVYPLDFARTRLAADVGTKGTGREFYGLLDCLRKVSKPDGAIGLYRGFGTSVQFVFIHRAAYFGIYNTSKDFFLDTTMKNNFVTKWILAQCVTTLAGLISYPFDTVRRRMMMQSGLKDVMYVNTRDCWKKTFMTEGPRGFYKGALANIIRGTGCAILLLVNDEIQPALLF